MLTKRERVYASIKRQGFDAIPWQFDLTSAVAAKLRAYYGTDDITAATDDHIVYTGPSAPTGFISELGDPGTYRDEFGVVHHHTATDSRIGDWGGFVSHPLTSPNLKEYRFPDGNAPGRWESAKNIRKAYPDHFIVSGGYDLFTVAWTLCGFENYLSYLGGEPAFVEELTEHLADFSCKVIAQMKGLEIDGIRFADDWGFQDRLMMRPEVWRKYLKEPYRRVFSVARDAGLVVMIHSCGNITAILSDLIEIGVQVVHPLQPEAMDVVCCQREFGKDLTFWGALGSQSTLPYGTPDDVRAEVRQRLELFSSGGYILAPAGAAPTETPAENVAAIVEVARQQLCAK